MELRSSGSEQKYRNLESSLTNLGLYEDGMKYEEMKQIMQALQESALECETEFFNKDMERALKESELEFAQMRGESHCSTMIKHSSTDHNSNVHAVQQQTRSNSMHLHGAKSSASPFSSPEVCAQKLTVHAQVHHAGDWSPPQSVVDFDERLQRKRFSDLFDTGCNDSNAEHMDCDVKRLKSPIGASSPLLGRSDSGIHSHDDDGDSLETL